MREECESKCKSECPYKPTIIHEQTFEEDKKPNRCIDTMKCIDECVLEIEDNALRRIQGEGVDICPIYGLTNQDNYRKYYEKLDSEV